MTSPPRSWAASIVGFCFAVLAACLALKLAAEFLLDALPVLLPAAAVVVGSALTWRWWRNRSGGW